MPVPLTAEQQNEVQAICDEICGRLETEDEYAYDLGERRGKAGGFLDEVWNEALRRLQQVGFDAQTIGSVVQVRKGLSVPGDL